MKDCILVVQAGVLLRSVHLDLIAAFHALIERLHFDELLAFLTSVDLRDAVDKIALLATKGEKNWLLERLLVVSVIQGHLNVDFLRTDRIVYLLREVGLLEREHQVRLRTLHGDWNQLSRIDIWIVDL